METNYRLWRQYDDEWNQTEAWPEAEYPYAKSRYMRESGCFITALSIMLRRYNIETEENPEVFNPRILCENMKKIGAYDRFADISPEDISRLYPIEYLNTIPYSFQKLEEFIAREQPCLVMVPGKSGPYHYVVPNAIEGGRVKICDPAFDEDYLDAFQTIYYIVLFRKRGFISDYTVKFFVGSLDRFREQCREFLLPSENENAERDLLVKTLEKWGTGLSTQLSGEYVAVLRNIVTQKLFLFRSRTGKQELRYYRCQNGRLLYGSEAYITAREEYRAEAQHSEISSLLPGECVVYDEQLKSATIIS